MFFVSFNHAQPIPSYTLSLHDALPIFRTLQSRSARRPSLRSRTRSSGNRKSGYRAFSLDALISPAGADWLLHVSEAIDRKSTRLNSSHLGISYAVFCLKKKNHKNEFDN